MSFACLTKYSEVANYVIQVTGEKTRQKLRTKNKK